ncbi:MAG: hypothetical protein PHF61_10785, partial [Bacteroidales bacterium]|nr:hypothetical protein [Bacteroidales bacterium]
SKGLALLHLSLAKSTHGYPIIFQKRDVSGSFLRGKIRILSILKKRFCQIFSFERKRLRAPNPLAGQLFLKRSV